MKYEARTERLGPSFKPSEIKRIKRAVRQEKAKGVSDWVYSVVIQALESRGH